MGYIWATLRGGSFKRKEDKVNDWLDAAMERIRNMSKEELKSLLDRHGIEYTEKEVENERKPKESNGNC